MGTFRELDITKRNDKVNLLADKFKNRIFGQPEATDALIGVLEKFTSGCYDRTKPIGDYLFLGPTGVGKTACCEAFVEGLFGHSSMMLKVDCAEFQHSHEIAKLIGSPPGYLGHRETKPFFTNDRIAALQTPEFPFTVILFDEIEKASDALWNLLLGIMDKGTLTSGTNEIVDMSRTIIIMTSNVGSKEMSSKLGDDSMGFVTANTEEVSKADLERVTREAAKRKFMPEFLNRLDGIVVFNTLPKNVLNDILNLEIENIKTRVYTTASVRPVLVVSPSARARIIQDGYDTKYNARYLKREIESRVSMPLSRVISSGQIENYELFIVDYYEEKYHYIAEKF